MDSPHDTDERLTNLEIKSSFAEDLLDHLNRLVTQQQQQIDLLLREVHGLRRQLWSVDHPDRPAPEHEPPPHY